jgi:antitoxin FitA
MLLSEGGVQMAQVLVRDVEPTVIEKLKARAKENGRSLEAELRLILQRAAGDDIDDALAEVERVRALFAGRTFSDSAELVREDRER